MFSNNQLVLQRQIPGMEEALTDICYELIYPTEDRYLTADKSGKIIWDNTIDKFKKDNNDERGTNSDLSGATTFRQEKK